MKKILTWAFIIILAIVAVPAQNMAADAPIKSGLYSIEAGKEQYYSMKEFKDLPKTMKKEMFKGKWYIVTGTSVYPMMALIMTTPELPNVKESITTFESKHKVDLSEILTNSSTEDFDIVGIE